MKYWLVLSCRASQAGQSTFFCGTADHSNGRFRSLIQQLFFPPDPAIDRNQWAKRSYKRHPTIAAHTHRFLIAFPLHWLLKLKGCSQLITQKILPLGQEIWSVEQFFLRSRSRTCTSNVSNKSASEDQHFTYLPWSSRGRLQTVNSTGQLYTALIWVEF